MRVAWGMDLHTYMNGDPQAMKYPNPNDNYLGWACFMFERWAAPEFFHENNWNAQRFGDGVDLLGPFPRRGDYILVAPLMTDDYEPLDLSSALLAELNQRVQGGSQTKDVLGLLEISRRVKVAKNAALVNKLLDERFEYYKQNAEKINAVHSRKSYVGLTARMVDQAAHNRTGSLVLAK